MMIYKSWCKTVVWFNYIFNIFFWNPIRFSRINPGILILAGINTNYVWNIPERKYFAPLKTLNLFIKPSVHPFVDIALTLFDSSFNPVSFKSVFFTKLTIAFFGAKFACPSLAIKLFAVNLLNSWVVIYLSWSWSAVRLVVVATLVILGILFLTSFF